MRFQAEPASQHGNTDTFAGTKSEGQAQKASGVNYTPTPIRDRHKALHPKPTDANLCIRPSVLRERPFASAYASWISTLHIAWSFAAGFIPVVEEDPPNERAAMKSKNAPGWRIAMDTEVGSLVDHDAWWPPAPLPRGQKWVDGRFVYVTRFNKDGSIKRLKARYVARGFNMKEGLDYVHSYSPTPKHTCFRLLLALCAWLDWECLHIDAHLAYLNGPIQTETWLKPPSNLPDQKGPGGEQWYCKLKYCIYGLPPAGRQWYQTMNNWMCSPPSRKRGTSQDTEQGPGKLNLFDYKKGGYGLEQSKADSCLYMSKDRSLWVLVYVDDILVFSKDKAKTLHFYEAMAQRFKMTNEGELSHFLGMEIERDRKNRTIKLHQRKYCLDMLRKYNMQNCNPARAPSLSGSKLNSSDCPKTPEEKAELKELQSEYMSIVGSMIYLSICSRPDISYRVGELARFMSNPGRSHMAAAKYLLRYIAGTTDLGILYGSGNGIPRCVFWSDADWAADPETRRSTTGYVGKLLGSGVFSWKSRRQPTVALSTSEAELMALTATSQEAVFIRQVMKDLGFVIDEPTEIREDNQGAIHIAQNPESSQRTKHVAIRHFYVRELIDSDQVTVNYERTDEMLADALTKNLGHTKMLKFRQQLLNEQD